MVLPAIVYIPRLHPEFVPGVLRARVFFVPPGLAAPSGDRPDKQSCSGPRDDPQETIRRALPFSPGESRAVLEEMLRLGREHASDGILGQLAALQLQDSDSGGDRAGELAALDAFASTGEFPDSPGGKPATVRRGEGASPERRALRQVMADSQKLLLLAYALEEDVLDSARLEGHFARAEESLHASLGEDDAGELRELIQEEAPCQDEGLGSPPDVPVSWQVMAEAMFPFLPDDVLLLTADQGMARDLHDAGLLRPLSDDKAKALSAWPHDLSRNLSWTRLPAWRLAGRRSCPPGRPWLDREYDVLVAGAPGEPADSPVGPGSIKD